MTVRLNTDNLILLAMSDQAILKEVKKPPPDQKQQVLGFIGFLKQKYRRRRRPQFGSGKGTFEMMPDFDEPLNELWAMVRSKKSIAMESDIKYLTDKKGKRTAVQIPYEDWKLLTQENEKLKQLIRMKSDLQEAFQEVEAYQQGKISLKSLDQLLDEL